MVTTCPVKLQRQVLPDVVLCGPTSNVVLANGVGMPCLGFGTYLVPDEPKTRKLLHEVLDLGVRHVDTAQGYGNEAMVGDAWVRSGLKRDELFITSKLVNEQQGYESAKVAFEESLERLKTSYLDLYLIHWPKVAAFVDEWETRIADTWRSFEDLYQEGRVRAIGVSNFMPHHLEVLLRKAQVVPHVNQIELNPGYQQRETVAYCEQRGIQIEAWGPLGRGKLLGNAQLVKIAKRHGVSTAQVCIRWALRKGYVLFPKSLTLAHIASNLDVFGFELSDDDMAQLDALDTPDAYTFHPDKLDEWAERVAAVHKAAGV